MIKLGFSDTAIQQCAFGIGSESKEKVMGIVGGKSDLAECYRAWMMMGLRSINERERERGDFCPLRLVRSKLTRSGKRLRQTRGGTERDLTGIGIVDGDLGDSDPYEELFALHAGDPPHPVLLHERRHLRLVQNAASDPTEPVLFLPLLLHPHESRGAVVSNLNDVV
ncbi:hypothetical protein G2W53_002767 [Senna tora]|uniref:Uncharacterized protein n=1 Tax=Senna tora TaxID=362788 RepID=A0A834XAF1_9FABA|nr:hypothetical protein G2W53_002767 [Senna tora]